MKENFLLDRTHLEVLSNELGLGTVLYTDVLEDKQATDKVNADDEEM